MSTIKINELATSNIALTDFFAKADANGVANKSTIQELSNLLKTVDDTAFKGSIAIANVPSENGWYFASESGTYTNCGGLVINTSNNISIIIISGTFDVFNKIDIPVSVTIDATVIDGSTNAVQGGAVADANIVLQNQITDNKTSIDSFANGNGKTYTSIALAMGATPLPSDNTPFTVRDSTGGVEDGYYVYLSLEAGGYKFLDVLKDGKLDVSVFSKLKYKIPSHPGNVTMPDSNVWGFTTLNPVSKRIHMFWRRGVAIELSYGEVYTMYSDDDGATFTEPVMIFTESNMNLANASGGCAPDGTIVVFYVRYDDVPSWPSFKNIEYRRSTDDGATWSVPSILDTGTSTIFSSYGKMETLDNGDLLQSWYGEDPTFDAYVTRSTDSGATWGASIALPVDSGAVTETDILALGDGNVMSVSRIDGSTTYKMCLSTDNGLNWSYSGAFTGIITFTNISPCWLEHFNDQYGQKTVALYYYKRGLPIFEQELRVIYALAKDIISEGASAFKVSSERILISDGNGAGYPSAVHPYNDVVGVGWVINRGFEIFQSLQGSAIGQIWEGRKLGLGVNPVKNSLATKDSISVGFDVGAQSPIGGALIKGDVGLGVDTSVGSLPTKLVVKSTGVNGQLTLANSDTIYTRLKSAGLGFSMVNTGGINKYMIGSNLAPIRTLHVFDDLVTEFRLSNTITGLYAGGGLSLSGNVLSVEVPSSGYLKLPDLLATAPKSVVPTSFNGATYLDDGTNTLDGNPHFRTYIINAWHDL